MSTPSFSIIIPAYNCGSYLSVCINSILNSDIDGDEIVLIDDGSDDETGAVCDAYSRENPFIKTVHTNHIGVSCARNLGIRESAREYLLFVDGDDFWDSSFRLNELRTIISEQDSDLWVFGCRIRKFRNDVYKDSLVRSPSICFNDWRNEEKQFLYFFNNGIMFSCCNKVFRKAHILDSGLFFRTQQMEDFLFVLDYLDKVQAVSFLPIAPYIYCKRIEGTSLTKQIHPEMVGEYNVCHQRFLSLFDPELSNTVHQIMAPQYIATINKCLRYNNDDNARSILASIKQTPFAKLSLRAYEPVSVSDKITISLMQKGLYDLLSFYRKCVAVFRRNQSYE